MTLRACPVLLIDVHSSIAGSSQQGSRKQQRCSAMQTYHPARKALLSSFQTREGLCADNAQQHCGTCAGHKQGAIQRRLITSQCLTLKRLSVGALLVLV